MASTETHTGKVTPFGMEKYFLVPLRRVVPLLPDGLEPFSFLGRGLINVGVWNHAETFIDEVRYGPAIEVWATPLARYDGKNVGTPHTIYNSNPRYAEAVSENFKFTKVPAEIDWREVGSRREVRVSKDGRPVISLLGRPTAIPFPFTLPASRPRWCYLLREGRRYLVKIDMDVGRTSVARIEIAISPEGPLRAVAEALQGAMQFSVSYVNSRLDVPPPVAL